MAEDGWRKWATLLLKNTAGMKCADSVAIVGMDGAVWTQICEDESVGVINVSNPPTLPQPETGPLKRHV